MKTLKSAILLIALLITSFFFSAIFTSIGVLFLMFVGELVVNNTGFNLGDDSTYTVFFAGIWLSLTIFLVVMEKKAGWITKIIN